MDRSVDFLAGRGFTVIACCCNNDDARSGQGPDGPAKRIVSPGLDCRSSKAQIHHANVIRSAIGKYPIKSIDKSGGSADTVSIKYPDIDDLRTRGDTFVVAHVGTVTQIQVGSGAAGGERGYVGAVAILINRNRAFVCKICPLNNASGVRCI